MSILVCLQVFGSGYYDRPFSENSLPREADYLCAYAIILGSIYIFLAVFIFAGYRFQDKS